MGGMAGAFARAAPELWRRGLAPIPCVEKQPTGYRWGSWKHRQSAKFLEEMIDRHGDKNVGILTGKISRLTVVDVDDPGHIDAALERFGPSLIMIRSPSGGAHGYYLHNGERCRNLRSEGLAIDIKGEGGFVVAPPSLVPKGEYRIAQGTWDDLYALQPIRPGSLPSNSPPSCLTTFEDRPDAHPEDGRRNTILFAHCRKIVEGYHPHSHEDYVRAVLAYNREFETGALPENEALRTARQVWEYQSCGRNMVPGGEAKAVLARSVIESLSGDAIKLLGILQCTWGAAPGRDFPISARGMAPTLGWSEKYLRKIRQELLDQGRLASVRERAKAKRQENGQFLSAVNLYRLPGGAHGTTK